MANKRCPRGQLIEYTPTETVEADVLSFNRKHIVGFDVHKRCTCILYKYAAEAKCATHVVEIIVSWVQSS